MLVDKIIRYGRMLAVQGDSNTPIEIVEGLLDSWEILKVKQALASRGFNGEFNLPCDKQVALDRIKENKDDEIKLVLNTICYTEYRNPILNGIIKKFVINK